MKLIENLGVADLQFCGPEFTALAEALVATMGGAQAQCVAALDRVAITAGNGRDFNDFGPSAHAAFETVMNQFNPVERSNIFRGFMALRAAALGARIAAADLPASVSIKAHAKATQLHDLLNSHRDTPYGYPDDSFVKDLRFVMAFTVPMGARDVELRARLGAKTALRAAARHPGRTRDYVTGTWLRTHVDTRALDDFNADGWQRTLSAIAELMARRPAIAGLAMTSWLYDPQLAKTSPHLAYNRETPVRHGALSLTHGTTAQDIAWATARSARRRQLHAEGSYQPVAHSLLWSRQDMLEWARAQATSPTVR